MSSTSLVGKGIAHFKDVETLILDHFPVVFQEVHAQFQMFASIDIFRHYAVVGSVKENLTKQFD